MSENVLADEKQLVVFNLDKEFYAVDIVAVTEIIQMQQITNVPGSFKSVDGVINLRGSIIPIVDLRTHFNLSRREADGETRIIIVNYKGDNVGVIVDSLSRVIRVPVNLIEPSENLFSGDKQEYIIGVAKLKERLVIMLDMVKVLDRHDIEVISADDLLKIEKDAKKEYLVYENATA
jgi:purine-binding chemotaxis protein CheW